MIIQKMTRGDLDGVVKVLDETGLFPSDMLADMSAGYLAGTRDDQLWLSCMIDDSAAGFCFAQAEALTHGTWNMLAIAILPHLQGRGYGAALCASLENALRANGQRLLIVDTSGTAQFAATRRFYDKNGYTQESRIRNFWAQGDDKVTHVKPL